MTLTSFGFGGEGGYFVQDNLALKLGFGVNYLEDTDQNTLAKNQTTSFTYKLGAKYYANNAIPVQIDFTGASIENVVENPLWLGIQGGYAFFIHNKIAIEPGIRYNMSLNNDFSEDGVIEARIGASLFL